MELIFGHLITHGKSKLGVIFVILLILQQWQQSSICVLMLNDDQLSSNFIICFILLILNHIRKIKIMSLIICRFVVLPHKPRFQTET